MALIITTVIVAILMNYYCCHVHSYSYYPELGEEGAKRRSALSSRGEATWKRCGLCREPKSGNMLQCKIR